LQLFSDHWCSIKQLKTDNRPIEVFEFRLCRCDNLATLGEQTFISLHAMPMLEFNSAVSATLSLSSLSPRWSKVLLLPSHD
jgi:hypothetical protein